MNAWLSAIVSPNLQTINPILCIRRTEANDPSFAVWIRTTLYVRHYDIMQESPMKNFRWLLAAAISCICLAAVDAYNLSPRTESSKSISNSNSNRRAFVRDAVIVAAGGSLLASQLALPNQASASGGATAGKYTWVISALNSREERMWTGKIGGIDEWQSHSGFKLRDARDDQFWEWHKEHRSRLWRQANGGSGPVLGFCLIWRHLYTLVLRSICFHFFLLLFASLISCSNDSALFQLLRDGIMAASKLQWRNS